jgi:catechol 2,3-dioxygenase-like lactoylglutathione lyase family enzyme
LIDGQEAAVPKIVGIEHIVLHVGDLERSAQFYETILGFLGFKREWEFGRVVGWDNGETMVWIRETDARGKKKKFRLGDIGIHHYAFELAKRDDVDDLHALLKKHKIRVVDPPADYPSYGDGYYAVFFLDPDGIKLEGVYFAEKQKRRARRKKSPSAA